MEINKKEYGFTMMELIVVVAIMGIMSAISLVPLSDSKKKKEMESSARKVSAVIREAQNNAFSGKKADLCTSWQFEYGPGQDFVLRGVGVNCPISNHYTLGRGISFVGVDFINFNLPHAEISNAHTIQLQDSSGNCYSVDVNPVGKIESQPC